MKAAATPHGRHHSETRELVHIARAIASRWPNTELCRTLGQEIANRRVWSLAEQVAARAVPFLPSPLDPLFQPAATHAVTPTFGRYFERR